MIRPILTIFFVAFVTAVSAQNYTDLRFTEVMYNAKDSGSLPGASLEFIELKNVGTAPVSLAGISFANGITYTFAGGILNAGSHLVLVSDSVNFKIKYPGILYFDEYQDTLSNKGELLSLKLGTDTFLKLNYNDDLPWPVLADGNGFSIVPTLVNPDINQSKSKSWRASTNQCGSPSVDDPTPNSFSEVVINECLPHTDLPQLDAIELKNRSTSSADISGWFVTDNRNSPFKFKIPQGTIIPAGETIMFDETDFNNGTFNLSFNRVGEHVLLFSADANEKLTGYEQGWEFEAQYNGVSFGIHTTSENEDHFVAQEAVTLNNVNSYPKVGPVVITQIMYNPTSLEDEYLVLQNITDTVVNLYSWQSADTTWKVSGIKYQFPSNISMQPGAEIILTDFNPANFRVKYSIPQEVEIFQYTGRLSNSGERVAVYAPERMDTTLAGVVYTPYVLVDDVDYNDASPWPLTPDGLGDRLVRTVNSDYGNDPINWQAANGSIISGITKYSEHFTKVFPNPTTGVFELKLMNFELETTAEVTITNAVGQVIYESIINNSTSTISITQPAGVYMVIINNGDEVVIEKVTKL